MPLNILHQSPHDVEPPQEESKLTGSSERFVPSRYTVRATTDDGRLILWNTFKGSMTVFESSDALLITPLLRKPGVDGPLTGWTKYLLDRGFLVKEGTNEYRQMQLAFGQQHYRNDVLQLILLASEDCNFRCEYCYEDFARGTMKPWVRAGIKRLVQKRIQSLKQLNINWFGGEPLYGFQAIEDLAPFFQEIAKEHSVGFRSGMTTNGFLLTPDIAEKLLSWQIRRYQITLDGRPEDHDKSRPARNGQGTFWTIVENLKSLSRRSDDFEVVLRVNFDRQNHRHMSEFMDILRAELGEDDRFLLRFHGIGRWGGENDEQLDVCGPDEAAQIRMNLKQEARKRGLNIGRGLKDVAGFGADVCYAARPFNFIVGASGKLMKCTVLLDKDDSNIVGRITEDGTLELDRNNLALWTEPAFETDTRCQKCVVLPSCQGLHCPLIRMEENRSPCSPVRLSLKQALRETSDLIQKDKKSAFKNGESAVRV